MKKILSLLASLIFVTINLLGQANDDPSNRQITMLRDFYTKYNSIWSEPPGNNHYNVNVKKSDSLMSNYCTTKLKIKATNWLEDGHDLITNDIYGKMDPKTLSVFKDLTKANEYIVSYTAHDISPYGNANQVKVIIHVKVVLVGNTYRIADIH